MKKLTAIFAVALTLALLLGAVVGFSASADESAPVAQAEEKWVISANVSYADDIHPYFAIDASLVEDASLLSVTVDGKATSISESSVQIKAGVFAYVVEAEGVSAKNISKALPIVVKYNGEIVEETSYSVAEYFFERLYKNDLINAAEAEDILRKELYIATLEYGAAAQKVLPVSGVPYVADFSYMYGEGIESGLYKNGDIVPVSAPQTAYKFYEYDFSGELINVGYTIKSAKLLARANVIVEAVDSVSSDFSGYTEAPKTGSVIGDLTFVDSNQSGALADYSIRTDEVYGNYYHVNDPYRTGTGYGRVEADGSVTEAKGQPIFRFVRSLDGVEGNTVIIDVLMRITDATESTIDTLYDGNNIDFSLGHGGTASTRSHRVYLNTSTVSNFKANSGDSTNVNTGVSKDEWFNFRIVHTSYGSTYSADSFFTQVYVNGNLISETSLQNTTNTGSYAPAEKITSLSILPSTDFLGSVDIAKVSFTQADITLEKTFAGNDFNSVLSVNSTVNEIKTTFTGVSVASCELESFANVSAGNTWLNWVDDSTSGGQSYIDFDKTVSPDATANKVSVAMDLRIDRASRSIPVSFRNTSVSSSRIEYAYLNINSGKIAASLDDKNWEKSDANVGEWFNLRIDIEKTANDNEFKTTIYINGVEMVSGTYIDEVYTISQINRARLVPDTNWVGNIRVDNISFTYTVPEN